MMYIHRDAKVCFLAQPRTASHSIAHALVEQLGFEVIRGHHDCPCDCRWRHRDLKGWFVISAIRNHFDALVSWYHLRNWMGSFDLRFLERLLAELYFAYPPQRDIARLYWKYLPHTTDVIRFENLKSDLGRILKAAGLAEVELPRLKASNGRRPYHHYFTQETRHFVEETFAVELAETGYTFILL